MKPHKWQTEIIAWANGARIEERYKYNSEGDWREWVTNDRPSWNTSGNWEYRVYDEFREEKEAFENGEQIEYSSSATCWEWYDTPNPKWDPDKRYRVKPKPKYLPFTFEEDGKRLLGRK